MYNWWWNWCIKYLESSYGGRGGNFAERKQFCTRIVGDILISYFFACLLSVDILFWSVVFFGVAISDSIKLLHVLNLRRSTFVLKTKMTNAVQA